MNQQNPQHSHSRRKENELVKETFFETELTALLSLSTEQN